MAINLNLNALTQAHEQARKDNCKARFAKQIREFIDAEETLLGFSIKDMEINDDEDVAKLLPPMRALAKKLADFNINIIFDGGQEIFVFVNEDKLPDGPEYNYLRSPKRKPKTVESEAETEETEEI